MNEVGLPYDSNSNPFGRRALRAWLAVMLVTSSSLVLLSSTEARLQRSAPPALVLDKTRHDFGEVFAGEDLTHAFWVRNVGTSPLEMSDRPLLTTQPKKASMQERFDAMAAKPVAAMWARSAAPS